MTRKLRVGIAGLGRIFDLNVLGYRDNPDVEIAALCDASPEALDQRGAALPDARRTRDFQEMLGWELDLVDILTPHPLHQDMAVAALRAGAHVSVQKPMALTLAECDAMITAAQQAGRRLKLFENFVFYPPLVKARDLLREGAIGRPMHFRMQVVIGDRSNAWHVPPSANAWRQHLGAAGQGGPLVFDHGHHLMAVALWLFGDARDGFACIETTRTPAGSMLDAPATLMWRHRGPPVHTMWDVSLALQMRVRTDYYASHERFEIQGEAGSIVVSRCSDRLLDEPVLTLYRDGEVRAFHNIDADWGNSFRLSTRHFVDVLRGREPLQILTGEEGRRVIQLHHTLVQSSRQRRMLTVGDDS